MCMWVPPPPLALPAQDEVNSAGCVFHLARGGEQLRDFICQKSLNWLPKCATSFLKFLETKMYVCEYSHGSMGTLMSLCVEVRGQALVLTFHLKAGSLLFHQLASPLVPWILLSLGTIIPQECWDYRHMQLRLAFM